MKSSKYSADTHALVWYFIGKKTLSAKAKKIIDQIHKGNLQCYISTMALLEAFHVNLKKPFNFSQFLLEHRRPNITVVPLDKKILSICYQLPKNFEIHDRIITATALVTNSILITKDPLIKKSQIVKTLW